MEPITSSKSLKLDLNIDLDSHLVFIFSGARDTDV